MCLSEQKPKIYASTVALVELAAARPAHDAWMAQADAALVASQQHFGQLHRRLERLAVAGHDRPCREEVSAIAAKAAEAVAREALEQHQQNSNSSSNSNNNNNSTNVGGPSQTAAGVPAAVEAALAAGRSERLALAADLADARQVMAQQQQHLLQFQQHLQLITQQQQQQPAAAMEQAMEGYWQRIQAFVTEQLSDFEQRVDAATIGGGSQGGGAALPVGSAAAAVDGLRIEMEEQKRLILSEVERKIFSREIESWQHSMHQHASLQKPRGQSAAGSDGNAPTDEGIEQEGDAGGGGGDDDDDDDDESPPLPPPIYARINIHKLVDECVTGRNQSMVLRLQVSCRYSTYSVRH